MDEFKIKIFKEENSGDIPYEELKGIELEKCVNTIKLLTSYNSGSEICADFFNHIELFLQYHMKIGDIDDPELFIQICSNLKLDLNDLDAFIVWRYPNEIDRFKLGSLKAYWDYIWYSMGDDAIVVVIPEKSIVILLTHYGDVKCNFNI